MVVTKETMVVFWVLFGLYILKGQLGLSTARVALASLLLLNMYLILFEPDFFWGLMCRDLGQMWMCEQ